MNLLWALVGLLGLVLVAVSWVLLRSRSDRSDPAPDAEQAPPSQVLPKRAPASWGKVLVVSDPKRACRAVLKIQGQTFPSEAAPRLPLADCSVANCRCHFVPAKERRAGTERRSGLDRRSQLRFEPGKPGDRRSGKDRRRRDTHEWDQTI